MANAKIDYEHEICLIDIKLESNYQRITAIGSIMGEISFLNINSLLEEIKDKK